MVVVSKENPSHSSRIEVDLRTMYAKQKQYATFKLTGDKEDSILSEDSGSPQLFRETRFKHPGGEEESILSEDSPLLQLRRENSQPKMLPQQRAGLLSQMTYSWLTPLMQLARKKVLTADDLYDTPPESGAERNADRFEAIWHDELQSKGEQKASVARCLLRLVGAKLLFSAGCLVIHGLCSVMSPAFFMSELLSYVNSQKSDPIRGALLVFGMTAMEVLRSLFLSWTWGLNCEAGVMATNGVMTAVYRKSLRLMNVGEQSPGEVINLFSNDGLRIFEAFNCGNFIIGPIVSGLAAAALTTRLVGMWGIFGFAVFFCMGPLQIGLSKVESKLRSKTISFTDLRIRLTNQAITSIRLIKQYSWIDAFYNKISATRDEERASLEKASLINGVLASVSSIIPSLASLATFTGLLLSTGSLTVLQAFTFITTLNALRWMTNLMPFSGKAIIDSLLATRRIKAMLIMNERSATYSHSTKNDGFPENQAVMFSAASFSWPSRQLSAKGKAEDRKMKDACRKEDFSLNKVTLNIAKGNSYGVCGEVGSGKSSFLASMTGLIPRIEGEMSIRGSVAYVAQQAWIMNSTLRDNILFGLPMYEPRYHQTIQSCGLNADIAFLPAGDLTEVGERGVTLSGGQKQRISLARAVYSDRDIYLLDDPLYAVDVGIGKHIHQNCIKGILRGKTIIFVTNQFEFLRRCDAVLLIKDGRVIDGVNVESLWSTCSNFQIASSPFTRALAADETKNNFEAHPTEDDLITDISDSTRLSGVLQSSPASDERYCLNSLNGTVPLLKQEYLEKGRVSLEACKGYVKAAGFGCFLLSMVLMVCTAICLSLSLWWLSFWLQNDNAVVIVVRALHLELILDTMDADTMFLVMYGTLIAAAAIFLLCKSAAYTKMSMRASSSIHGACLMKLLRSPVQFFDLTPTGQIINRFSKDIHEMDSMFPYTMECFIHNTLINLSSLALMTVGLPYMAASIVIISILVIGMHIRMSPGVRELKRLEHSARSKWFDHIAATAQGVSTIRAYGKEKSFLNRFYELTDSFSMSMRLYENSMRWLTVRFDAVHVITTTTAGCLIAFLPTQQSLPAASALAICNALSMSGLFQNMIRLSIESECRFLSIERLWSYLKELKSEEENVIVESIPECWPSKGEIVFDEVSLRYRTDLPIVLKAITLKIPPGEKIGIVGRTGSGKSSLGVALFRLGEIDSGRLSIDDVDIRDVPLQLLRTKLSIIPQDPVLFLGSLRYNLDPPGSHTDEELLHSMRRCNLMLDGRFSEGLDTQILEGGENLSVGERQLICMARALLRRSKILMMDEATASVDVVTDRLLMDTIDAAFAECTVLIIAHRLSTVLQCNRIVVMDNGKVAEMDTPEMLLKNETSLFYQLMKKWKHAAQS